MHTHRWTSPIVVLAVLCWAVACLPLSAQRPTRVWNQPELDAGVAAHGSVVFQGRLTMHKVFHSTDNPAVSQELSHLWLTDGTPAGSELIFADAVMSNAVVHGDLLYFVGLSGPTATQLFAYDGQEVTAVGNLDGCFYSHRLQIQGNRLFVSTYATLYTYDLTTHALELIPDGDNSYSTDGNLIALEGPGFDVKVRLLDAPDEGVVIDSRQPYRLHNGRVYSGGEQLLITDGTQAGTHTVAIPSFSAVTRIHAIFGVAGDQLLMGASISIANTDPNGKYFLAACNLNGDNIRVVRPGDPILVDPFQYYVRSDSALYFQDSNGNLQYSDGSAGGTKLLLPLPERGTHRYAQVYHHQNTDILIRRVREDYVNGTSALFWVQNGNLNPEPLFQEAGRHIDRILGPVGTQLLVSYGLNLDAFSEDRLLGLLNPDNGTLTPIANHEDFTDVGLPLTSFAQAGDTIAVLQKAEHSFDSSWLLFHNKRTGANRTFTIPAFYSLAAHNDTIYVSLTHANNFVLHTWNEETGELERLFAGLNNQIWDYPLNVTQSETRIGVWNGNNYFVFDNATQMVTTLISDIYGSRIGELNGNQIFVDRANFYVVNPSLTAVQTIPLSSASFQYTTIDPEFAYLGWYNNSSQTGQFARVNAAGTVTQFSLARPEQKINLMVSLSPQRVLVIDSNDASGTATLLAVNSDTQTVTPLLTFSSRCLKDGTISLVRAGDRAFLSAYDESHGQELWATDGTPAGTRMVTDLYPGARGSHPSFLQADGDTLTFRATGPGNQSLFWRLAPGEDTPVAVTDPALANRVGLRLLGSDGDQMWLTATERDLWWYHPQFPVTFDAPDSVCNNGETFTIHADAVHPDTQFEWTPVNADVVAGQDTATVTLRADGNGDVQINVAVALGDSTHTESLTLPLRTVTPAMPTLISGAVQPCALEENVRYTTPAIANAVSYEWSVPAGAVIVQGQGSSEVDITFGDQSGEVRVRTVNACGASDWRVLAITLTTDGIVANAGEDRVTCDTAYTLNAELPAGATGLWTLLDGDATLSDLTDPNAVLTFAGTGSATLSWRIKQGICPSAADTVTITYYDGFTLANAGDDIQVCSGLTTRLNANRPEWSTSGTWSVVSGEGGAFSSAGYSGSTFTGRPNVPYVLRWRLTGSPCSESEDTVSVIFYHTESVAPAPNQTISMGESTVLEPTTPSDTGYWEILFGPNRNLSQLSQVDTANTRFTPTQEGEYHLRWNYTPRNCTPARATTVVTVTNEAAFTSREARFARPPGIPTQRLFYPVHNNADSFLIGEGAANQPRHLVTPDGAGLSLAFQGGDTCVTTYAAPDGGVYAVTRGGAWAVNLYHRAANADTFVFVAGTDADETYNCNEALSEHGLVFDNQFFFTFGHELFALDLSQTRLEAVLQLETNRTDLLIWEGSLYAAGTRLWRYVPDTQTFRTAWYDFERNLYAPVIKTSHGLFWTAYEKSDESQTTFGLYFNNNPNSGNTMVALGNVSGLALVGDRVLFHHTRSGTGSEPWLSDGSEDGTRPLADLDPGPVSSAPARVTAFSHAGAAFFFRDGALWRYIAGAPAPTRFVALNELRAYHFDGDNLLLWDGHRMRRTPANTPAAQISVVYELDFLDQAAIDMLGVWQNRLYLQRFENGEAQVLAVPLSGGAAVTLNQDYRLPEATTTYIGSWDNRLLLLDSAGAFTLKRYDVGGNITPLLTFPQDPHPVETYQFSNTVFFSAGSDRNLYRSNGTFSGTSVLGNPALRQVESVTQTANGILFFAEDGSGERHAYFCGTTGGPQLLGSGVQPAQPRSNQASARFHTLADSAASLFFLENSNGSVTLWRWMDADRTAVRSNQFAGDAQRAVVAVADAQPDYCVFQISNSLFHYNGTTFRVTEITDADPTYYGTFDGTPLFLLGNQIGWVDRAGAWHQATPPAPISHIFGKIGPYVLCHVEGDVGTERWYALDHNRFEGTTTLPTTFAQIANLPGFLVFTTTNGFGVADRQRTQPEIFNATGYISPTANPPAVTDRALYYVNRPDTVTRFKGYRFSDSGAGNADYLGQVVFSGAGGPAADIIRWSRRLGEGLVLCIETPGMGQALWHLTNFSSKRVDTAPSPHPNYVLWAADTNRVVVADLSLADGLNLFEITATPQMFTDPVLSESLLLGYDENGDGALDAQERAAVTDLDLSGMGLQNLDGLELLPNLRALDVSDNLITDLGPLLDHPALGDDSGDFLDLSLNPLAEQNCIQIQTLMDRAFTLGDNLIISPNKIRGNPSYDTWPQNSILQLLRPGFTANPQPWTCATR